jgi:hypothetical protein
VEAAIGANGVLSVVCSSSSGAKDWSHAKVYVVGEAFCHESGATFFTREGAMKTYCIAIGEPFDQYEGSIEDYCKKSLRCGSRVDADHVVQSRNRAIR